MTEVSMNVRRDSSGACEVMGCRRRSMTKVPVDGAPRFVCDIHMMTLWLFASREVAKGLEPTDAGRLLQFRSQAVLGPVPVVRNDRGPGGGTHPSELRDREGEVAD